MTDRSSIEKRIKEGYASLSKHEVEKACDIWLDAWGDLKAFMAENDVNSVWPIFP